MKYSNKLNNMIIKIYNSNKIQGLGQATAIVSAWVDENQYNC